MAFLAQKWRGNQVGYREYERADLFCHHDSHGLATNMNMFSFCKSARLSTTLSPNQLGRFRDYFQGSGFCKQSRQPGQSCSQDLGVQSYPEVIRRPKHVIRANDPRLQKIAVVEHGFLIPEGSPVPEGILLIGSSSSHQAVEAEGDLGLFEEGFVVFDQVSPSEDPSGDLGDPALSEADLLSVETSSQVEMGFKRKPSTNLFDLIER